MAVKGQAQVTTRMGDVWDHTTEVVAERLPAIAPIAFFTILLPSAISGSLADVQMRGGSGMALIAMLLSLAFGILQLFGQLAIAALAMAPLRAPDAARVAAARLLSAIGIFLLFGLVVLVLAVPILALTALNGVDMARMQSGGLVSMTPGMAGAFGLYGVVVAVVGLVLGARLSVLLPVIVAERRGAGAILRAFRLTRGLTWRLIGVLLLYGLVVVVAVLAVRSVVGSVMRLLTDASAQISVASIVTGIAVAVVTTAFTVLATAFAATLYTMIAPRDAAPPADAL